MADVWTNVNNLDPTAQERLAGVLETRGAAPEQEAMRRAFLGDLRLAGGARVLDVGCGTGTLTRMIARWPGVGAVTGIDPARHLIEKARALAQGGNAAFQEADGLALPFEGGTFDVVTFDSVLSHIADPERALGEALRVLRRGGQLGIFDGDYSTTTVAIAPHDPLQSCVDAMMAGSLRDGWIVRRLPALVRKLSFDIGRFRSHGFAEISGADYMLTIIDRGVDLLRAAGTIGDSAAAALKAEARRRVAEGAFFGHVAYASLTASKAE